MTAFMNTAQTSNHHCFPETASLSLPALMQKTFRLHITRTDPNGRVLRQGPAK